MSNAGRYLYGFTDRNFDPPPGLCGLRGSPVRLVSFRDLAAVVSHHPVQRLLPSRSNVEPHHRVVRQVSAQAALVPAAFGHVSETEADLLAVLQGHYDEIRDELARLAHKCEMTVKLRWNVDNIYECMVRGNRELRELRDRVFRETPPSLNAKLQVGALFEATLTREREWLTKLLLESLQPVTCDSVVSAPRDEKIACHAALLVEYARVTDFADTLGSAAGLFNADFTLDYSGPWPPYSFVRLRVQPGQRTTAA
jgi:hypothetical protein